jgi:predicted CoA-binding protein
MVGTTRLTTNHCQKSIFNLKGIHTMANVAILGASSNPERYAWRALKLLVENHHTPFPVAIKEREIDGLKTYASLRDITAPIDTLTLYVSPDKVEASLEDIIALRPRRVIFNPGTESPAAMASLRAQGIVVEEACTLVLLRTGQF